MPWILSTQTARSCVAVLVLLALSLPAVFAGNCDEATALTCHALAYCDDTNGCFCGEGIVGNGVGSAGCNRESWTVRFTIKMPAGTPSTHGKLDAWSTGVDDYIGMLTNAPPAGFKNSMEHTVHEVNGEIYMTINALFADRSDANSAQANLAALLDTPTPNVAFGVDLVSDNYTVEPRIYTWVAKTTSAEFRIKPTGMDVTDVFFKPDCLDSGCWVVNFMYTIGEEDWNVLYLPHAVGNDQLSYDFDYSTNDAVWGKSPEDTFLPMNFPCGSDTYDYQSLPNGNPPHQITSCCIPEFLDMYRPIQSFKDEIDDLPITKASCDAADPSNLVIFERPNYDSGDGLTYTPMPADAIVGGIKGMALSNVAFTSVVDAYVGQYSGTMYLDEIELRQLAGKLTGTVGVEYAIDTFLGYANFKPTGLAALDPFAIQVNIRLEKTSFFTVSTFGENDYTFIEYVNVRLVTIFEQDEDLTESSLIKAQAESDMFDADGPTTGPDGEPVPADGMLSESEFTEAGLDQSGRYESFDAADLDGDGLLTFTEMAVHLLQYNEPAGFNVQTQATTDLAAADQEDDGSEEADGLLTEAEFIAAGLHTSDLYPDFDSMDVTGDGMLSKTEMTIALIAKNSADKTIDTHDLNDDGFIDQTEWEAGNLDESPIYPSFQIVDRNNDGKLSENEITAADTWERGQLLTRTDRSGAANYIQVTFTLGEQYQPIETGIIPLDSVLVHIGNGTDTGAIEVETFSSCTDYENYVGSFNNDRPTFDSRFPQSDGSQDCAPEAEMCKNPTSTPDQFVVFNIPVGIEAFPEPSNTGDNTVSLEMLVSVVDTSVDTDDVGTAAAGQMKTKIKAQIPVVEGGSWLFCDSIVAKTDLKDLANVDLIIGTAGYAEPELPRLTIHQDIANSKQDPNKITEINSDSIEAGFMTLVLKGNASYFQRSGTGLYSLEVEDLVTIHIMEEENAMMDAVLTLLASPGDDNNNANGLDTDGYALNGAFRFSVDRVNSRAKLLPTDDLYSLCPAMARRPDPNDAFPTTCVMRRDIDQRSFPAMSGQAATAMEIPSVSVPRTDPRRDEAAQFMQTVLGPSDYAYELGQNFSTIVAERYQLNERYMRAFWINPGYEWTPTQTGGQDLFTLSQKLVLFALINMNEGFSRRSGIPDAPQNAKHFRRSTRMLLQASSGTDGTGSSAGSARMVSTVTPVSMMANAYKVSEDLVATFDIEMQLTESEACTATDDLRRNLRETLDYHLNGFASEYQTVQVMSVEVDRNDVKCNRRKLAGRSLLAYSAATAKMEVMIVFAARNSACVAIDRLRQTAGVLDVTPRHVSPSIFTCDNMRQPTSTPLVGGGRQDPGFNPFAPSVPTSSTSGSSPFGNTGTSGLDNGVQNSGAGADTDLASQHPQQEPVGTGEGLPLVPIAGVLVCLALAAVAYVVYRKRNAATTHEASVIHSITIRDMKDATSEERGGSDQMIAPAKITDVI